MTEIQYYTSAIDNTGHSIDIDKVVQTITGPSLKRFFLQGLYEKLKGLKELGSPEAAGLQKKYDAAKKKLPAVTWAGTFQKRLRSKLITLSGLIVLDLDKLENLPEIKEKITAWPHCFICFTSPSGAGLKVVIKLEGVTPENFNDFFLSLEKIFSENFGVIPDPSGKDITRLCFLCYDPDLFLNPHATTYALPMATKLNKSQEKELQQMGEDFYSVIAFTDKISTYQEGNRNNYLFLFACNANRKGFQISETIDFAENHFTDLEKGEIDASIKSAYNNNSAEYGKYKKVEKTFEKKSGGNPKYFSTGESQDKPFTKFWQERTVTKGRGEDKYTFKTYELKRVAFTDFLFERGFHLMTNEKQKGYQICHSAEGIVKPVESWEIKRDVFDWCRKNVNRDIEEMLRKGQKQFFASNELDALHTKHIQLKRDTEQASNFYFKNCWVSVTANGITQHDYNELTEFIWAGNKREHDFKIENVTLVDSDGNLNKEAMNCEFARFVFLAAWNPKGEESHFSREQIDQRFLSFVTAIGFMLDGFKHPANRKGIFALDHKVGADKFEKNGRSGKSIIPYACSFLKVVSTINGKTYDPRYPFRYEPITADSQIVNFNDMRQSHDVEDIFEVIADNYSVIRRNNGWLHFEYENSPKVWYSANGIPKGDGGSYRARMHLLEFSDYFNPEFTPYDEFGHGLFSSAWDQAEWNRFYNFLLWCVQCYKIDGLVQYNDSHFDLRRMTQDTVAEFSDFMESEDVPRNTRLFKNSLLETYNSKIQRPLYQNNIKPHTFVKWVKLYCKLHGLHFNPHKQGGYDKSNGKEYYSIATTTDYTPKETEQQNIFANG